MKPSRIIEFFFDFLKTEYDYEKSILESEDKIVVIYESSKTKKRFEMASFYTKNKNYFIVRYLINDKFAEYNDDLYCIDYLTLLQLKINNYNVDEFISRDKKPYDFFKDCLNLITENKIFLSSNIWIDTQNYIQILEKHFSKFSKWEYKPNKKGVQQEFEDELINKIPNVKVIYNSEKCAPYEEKENWTSEYELNNHKILFRTPDFRDYNISEVVIDNRGSYMIDSFKDYKMTIKKIVEFIKQKYSC